MFSDEYHPKVKKDLKKIDISVQKEIRNKHISKILGNPFVYECLSGDLLGIYSYHFKATKTSYRICYIIDENTEIVTILMVGKRENFYSLLKQRLL